MEVYIHYIYKLRAPVNFEERNPFLPRRTIDGLSHYINSESSWGESFPKMIPSGSACAVYSAPRSASFYDPIEQPGHRRALDWLGFGTAHLSTQS